jgi:hypothetical protein
LVQVVLEGEEVATVERDHSTTILGTSVGHELLDRGEVVVPEVEGVTRVLLLIERDGEWNGLFDHI